MSTQPLPLSRHYHQRTKYTPESLRQRTRPIDWASQPELFKDYKIGMTYPLRPYLEEPNNEDVDNLDPEVKQQRKRLSRLLLCSYGLTVKVLTRSGESLFLRAAPSAGGLYPVEVYLVSRGTPFLPAGLYHYQPKDHSLKRFWDSDVWRALQMSCFWHPNLDDTQLALVTTAIYHRSAWRYRARAYRRILLDTGHVLGNVEMACAINGYRPHLIGGFADEAVNQMLYLDAEQEGAIAILALANRLDIRENLPLAPTALPSKTRTQYPGLADDELLSQLHQASSISPKRDVNWKAIAKHNTSQNASSSAKLPETKELSPSSAVIQDKYNFPFCLKVETSITPPIQWGTDLLALESTLLKRRSTRKYTGHNLTLDDLKLLFDFTYQAQHYIEQGLDPKPDYFAPELVETFIVVSGIEDLDEGCYYYAPHAQELRQIRFRNFREDLHYLCLGQELGRDASAVIFHTADLKQAVSQYGDRAYRYLHLDAAHLGQRLNVAATHLGLGVSGIGGFFDDAVNDVLGIPAEEAVLYITTLGKPQ